MISIKKLQSLGRYLACIQALLLAGCGSVPQFDRNEYVDPIGNAPAIENLTQYTAALDCLGRYIQKTTLPGKRIAVGRVDDFTGKQDLVNGKRVTQGASLMVISALARTRVPMVERLEFAVGEMELKYTDLKLIGDDTKNTLRQTFGGSVIGSDYFIVGGITEVNFNVRSGALDSAVKFVSGSGRYAVLDIGLDLRLVNTRTLEIVKVASLRKQIIGTEVRFGIFRFLNDTTIDISAAERSQEPIQKGIRMLAERAVFEFVSELYKVPENTCAIGPERMNLKTAKPTAAGQPGATQSTANQPTVNRPSANQPVNKSVSGNGVMPPPALFKMSQYINVLGMQEAGP